MPFFEPEDAKALASENLEVSATISLHGLGAVEALARVEEALVTHQGSKHGVRLLFAFDPPSPGAGETLFLPVGRRLRDEVKAGRAVRAMPAQADGTLGGWIVRLKGQED
jgi:hypothetical protein